MITHWCLRALATELMKAGFHVLRFDYSCQGDSWGSFEQVSVKQWVADVKVAAQELTDNAGVSRLSVVGLRLEAPAWLTSPPRNCRWITSCCGPPCWMAGNTSSNYAACRPSAS